MNVSIKQLRAFVAIAEAKSFVEAQDVVHLSQPALSISIRKLEDAVGGRLLARTTRSITLTPEGATFLPTAKRLIGDWDDGLDDLKRLFEKKRGKLLMAAIPSYAANQLPQIVAAYHNRYPSIDLNIQDVVAEQVVEMVRAGRVEFGVTFDPQDAGELMFEPLFLDRFVVAMPADHSFAKRKQVSWHALQSSPLVLLQHPSSIRQQIEQMVESHNFTLSVVAESHQLATLGRMVVSGLGLSIVPGLCASQMREIGAICRPLGSPEIARNAGVLLRRRIPLSSAAQAMVDALSRFHGGTPR